MNSLKISIDEICHVMESKDNNENIRIDLKNLKLANENLIDLLGDNMDFFINTLKYAFKVLLKHFKSWMDNCYDNDSLSQIEDMLINFTKLHSELHTCGIKNRDLKAFAYYGLHIVYFIRGEYKKSIINVFKIFIVNPRKARRILCVDFYNYYFYPIINEELKIKLKCIPVAHNYDYKNMTTDEMRNDSDLRRYRLEEIDQYIDSECVRYAELELLEYKGIGEIL